MDHPTASASFAPESPDLSSYYAGEPQPVLPQHQGYRGSVSLHTPYTPGGGLDQSFQHTYQLNQAAGYAPPPTLQYPQMPRTRAKREHDHDDDDYVPQTPLESTDRLKRLHMEGNGNDFGAGGPAVDMGIMVKTKFPVARIKRIMQADDDVGKVAQVTPVAVSKALELFMISLVTKAATEAKQRSSKRVAAMHLKQAITKDEQFDFLADIVSKVADAPTAVEKNDDDEQPPESKKRKGTGRRKKKEDSEEL